MIFHTAIIGNVDKCRTECEITDDAGETIALVYDTPDGFHVDLLGTFDNRSQSEFEASVSGAKEHLAHYVNRRGTNPPSGMTRGGLSFWLMEKDDGTTLGLDLHKPHPTSPPSQIEVPDDAAARVKNLARVGRSIEAIRELRIAADCSLADATAWLKDHCE